MPWRLVRRSRWYAARLAAMSFPELLHRLREAARRAAWRRAAGGWDSLGEIGDGPIAALEPLRHRLAAAPADRVRGVADRLVARMEGEGLELLGRRWPRASSPPPPEFWWHDPVSGNSWPGAGISAFSIDVRQTGAELGDVKFVWECNRLQFLHPVAAEIARTGRCDLRRWTLGILSSWAVANPPYQGVNWVSGIELSMRLVTVALVCAALGPDTLNPADRTMIRRLIVAHARHLAAFPSKYSSANNHLVAEGLGLFLAGLLVADHHEAPAWLAEGRRVLEEEAVRQILSDGVGAEQSPTYQAFTMEMLCLAERLARDAGEPLAAAVGQRLAAGAEFLSWILDDGGNAPAIGDDDEGRVLAEPDGREPRYTASIAAVAAALGGCRQPGSVPRDRHLREWVLDLSEQPGEVGPEGLRIFREGGYSVWRNLCRGRRAHLVFDHGPLGYLSLAAHGHADALAVWLSLDGRPVFVDAGTYLYHSGGDRRRELRESLAHNTLAIRDISQSTPSSAFSWTRPTDAFLLGDQQDGSVRAAHDGYRRRFGVRHVRSVQPDETGFVIEDSLAGAADPLDVSIRFLCAPGIDVVAEDGLITLSRQGRIECRLMPPADFVARNAPHPYSPEFGTLESALQVVLSGRLGRDPAPTRILLS